MAFEGRNDPGQQARGFDSAAWHGCRPPPAYTTIEGVLVLDARTLLFSNDNNDPFSVGRHIGSKAPDDNEFILITLPKALNLAK